MDSKNGEQGAAPQIRPRWRVGGLTGGGNVVEVVKARRVGRIGCAETFGRKMFRGLLVEEENERLQNCAAFRKKVSAREMRAAVVGILLGLAGFILLQFQRYSVLILPRWLEVFVACIVIVCVFRSGGALAQLRKIKILMKS